MDRLQDYKTPQLLLFRELPILCLWLLIVYMSCQALTQTHAGPRSNSLREFEFTLKGGNDHDNRVHPVTARLDPSQMPAPAQVPLWNICT